MKNRHIFGILLVALGMLWGSNAYADCKNLDTNPQWRQLFEEFNGQIKAGNDADALKTTQKLQDICSESPILNYAISRVYRNMGDHGSELKYLIRATDNAAKFNVNEETVRKFWYARYEAEHPEILANKTQVEENSQTLKDLNEALEESRKQAAASEHAGQLKEAELQYKEEKVYKALMWSGGAIGGVGIAMAVTGGALLGIVGDKKIENETISQGSGKAQRERVDYKYTLSIGLLGAGVAATVAGAIAAGFGGYLYTHKKDSGETVLLVPHNMGASLLISF